MIAGTSASITRPRAADPPVRVAAPGLDEHRVPRLEAGRVVVGAEQRRHRLEHPVRARAPGLGVHLAVARPGLDRERRRAVGRADAAPVPVVDALGTSGRRRRADGRRGSARPGTASRVATPAPDRPSTPASLAATPDTGTRSSLVRHAPADRGPQPGPHAHPRPARGAQRVQRGAVRRHHRGAARGGRRPGRRGGAAHRQRPRVQRRHRPAGDAQARDRPGRSCAASTGSSG